MAGPTSSREREREREHSSSSRRHSSSSGRISSTTLLLVLSLVLAVLAVLLSLPSRQGNAAANPVDPNPNGIMGLLTPKRSKDLINREADVALRELNVAKREADLLAGSAGGFNMASCPTCPPAPTETAISVVTITAQPMETTIVNPPPYTTTTTIIQIQEVAREVEMVSTQPDYRQEEASAREQRVSEREKDVGRREETVGRRETDISRRENWVMEQLVNLNEGVVEEEHVYEERPRRRVKNEVPAPPPQPIFFTVTEPAPDPVTIIETHTSILVTTETASIRYTVTVPEPAGTRVAAPPNVSSSRKSPTRAQPTAHTVEEIVEETHHMHAPPPPPPPPPRQRKVVEVYDDDEEEDDPDVGPDGYRTVTIKHTKPPRYGQQTAPTPKQTASKRWFGGRF